MNLRGKKGGDFMVVLSYLVGRSSSTYILILESIQPVEVHNNSMEFFFLNSKPSSLVEVY